MSDVDVRALWAQVPSVNCRGLCTEACGPIGMSDAESAILDRRGVDVMHDRATLTCNQLKFGRCAIYEDRPMVCRLWGAIPEMPCPFGCAPTLSSEEGRALIRTIFEVDA